MEKAFNLIAACAMLAGASGAFGQVKCTMPNGKTITLNSAPRCPADATKATTLDGQPLPNPNQTPEGMQVLEQRRVAQETMERAKIDKSMAAMDARLEEWKAEGKQLKAQREADRTTRFEQDSNTLRDICKVPEVRNFYSCEVNTKVFGTNSVDITDANLRGIDRQDYCKTVASKLRRHLTPNSPVSGTWALKIWAPMKSQVQVECTI